MEPPSDYHADNSRSDLSDILEEEEEDLYSDHFGEAQARGYTVGARRVKASVHYMVCFLNKMMLLLLCLAFSSSHSVALFLLSYSR